MAVPAVHRTAITIAVLMASLMNTLDMTIANVALPHIQGSVSASQEQIAWVLTSYIVASAVMTPLAGWLGGRFGRRNLLLVSVAAFTAASMLCGTANSVAEIVGFRLLQGIAGAALTPLSQSLLLDITPPHKHAQAMALWGGVSLLGPVLGPVIGGWLTDQMSWRWVFYINLPIGILSFLGVWVFLARNPDDQPKPFDFLGFAALTLFLGALQLMLDRGPSLDWFASVEICIYLVTGAIALWVFLVHTLTVEHPFFDRRLAQDGNFVAATLFSMVNSVLMFGAIAALPAMTQGIMQYPVLYSGIVSIPRGLGSMFAMLVIGRMLDRFSTRAVLTVGILLTAQSFWQMTRFDLSMDAMPLLTTGLLQGFGVGITFVPVTTFAFSTIPPALRAEASTVFTLCRSIGAAVGISIMQAILIFNIQANHEAIAGRVNPADPMVSAGLPAPLDPSLAGGLANLNGFITREATMIGYVDNFYLMFWMALLCLPLMFLLRPVRKQGENVHVAVD